MAAIWTYGRERWGIEQADLYADRISQAMAVLEDFPGIGRALPGRRDGARSMLTGRHRILYRLDGHSVRVNRVLHVKMDYGRHLP